MNGNEINRAILSLGLTPRHKGFHFLSAAVLNMFGGLAPEKALARAAEERGEEPARLDRCVRYAVAYAWDMGGGIRRLFPGCAAPPSPVELMYVLFWKLDEEKQMKTEPANKSGSDQIPSLLARRSL